ncbi:AMP-binding domain-containing protein [Planoprotostelium fungivorum]|uniref:AMP-binding domain-containing protein n=1 Tax=Planoprotostelium fungivorum TaxID=1890364 RepID=A0A2P6NC49_9EUKA|nr:AMP-binding domain-containing protein [Planoprotostelium fungivorum]
MKLELLQTHIVCDVHKARLPVTPTRSTSKQSYLSLRIRSIETIERLLCQRTITSSSSSSDAPAVLRRGNWSKCVLRVSQGIKWSWREFRERVDSMSSALADLDYKRGLKTSGDRLLVWMPTNAQWLVAAFAAFKLGVILVNANPAYRPSELEHALELTEPKGVVVVPEYKSSNYIGMLKESKIVREKGPHIIHVSDSELLDTINIRDMMGKIDARQKERVDEYSSRLEADDVINIQFTSGTTGFPKGASLTHKNLLNNAMAAGDGMCLTPLDRLCIPVPLYHCFGITLDPGCLAAITHGSTMIFPSPGFDPKLTLEAVQQEKCTALHGVPTMFISELALLESQKYDISRLRTGIMAGTTCPEEIMVQITIGYGMTETSPLSFQSHRDTPLQRRTTTVGKVLPHTEVKIIDKNGTTVPVGEPGELLVRGYQVMKGYWRDEAKTQESIDNEGWMYSGDLGVIDEEGYCSIVGRNKDIIIRGGENISPREIEEFLYKHPSIMDVQVIGVPDVKYGEQICAWIIVKEGHQLTVDDVTGFCRGKIAHYKIPHYVLFVDQYPMTVSGKKQSTSSD